MNVSKFPTQRLAFGLALSGIPLPSACAHAQSWQPVPMMTAAQRAAAKIGGEGAQAGRTVRFRATAKT